MSSESKNSGPHSGTTSGSGPATPAGEADYLSQQEKDAREAINRTLQELKDNLAHGIDPRAWAQERPWLTVGSAAAAGFILAWGLVPSREEAALKRLAAIENAIRSNERAPADNGGPADGGKSVLTGIAGSALAMLKPALISALTSGLGAKAGQTGPVGDGEQGPNPSGHAPRAAADRDKSE